MLDTNDAHDGGSRWSTDCGGPDSTGLQDCPFFQDFQAMVRLVKTLGTTPAGPKIYLMIPPPLMAQYPQLGHGEMARCRSPSIRSSPSCSR